MSRDSYNLPSEFLDVSKVLDMGATKYGRDSWLHGNHFNHKDNTASMFRHLAEHYNNISRDKESGLDPLLHLASRALMAYTVKSRYSIDNIDEAFNDKG